MIDTAFVFACRYAHNRNTGGACLIVSQVMEHWEELNELTQQQIIKESFEATTNQDDWQRLRDFAEEKEAG